ncbi:BtrH N-terminal domain-containing protein [Halovivax gelatinilyticus]|uniref:BtrH N-terminal domain-containing protein n=1 Tax=Halovivax gelatinilyticus TaxID=2961597 RepID=UPI0020CA6A43|nr:BtrH N-terminal domain-containing protein [Halovivax gelatinilyticus]
MTGLSGYEHATGDHCGSTSLRNLGAHFGWPVDEPTSFGLASGLGFTYFELPESPHRGFFGRPLWIEDAHFDNRGIAHDLHRDEPWEAVEARLRDRTAAGDPVMVYTDIFHLDYFDTGTHFAPHTLLVVGVDGETAVLSDSEFESLQRIPLSQLREAMASDAVFDLSHRHLVVTDAEPTVSLADATRRAIATTARYMLDPESVDRPLGPGAHGLDGIRRFAADLPTWTALPDPQWTVRFAYQNVERRGTGGATFRRLYARFLDRATADHPELDPGLADRTHAIADDWNAIGATLKSASELDSPESVAFESALAEASEAVEAVADRERALYRDLIESVDPPADG